MAASLLNALIGEYRLTEPLGAGGMGEVYKAVHVTLGRVIAVKILFRELADGAALQRFYAEADIQASLRHPGVAEYLGFYELQGRPCILMEYVDGETLAALIRRRGPLPYEDAAAIIREICAVAGHFHSLGLVHRDLKTSNVKRNSAGRVKILDFGIARHQRSDRLTRTGAVIGTTEILSPEQVRGEAPGFGTDVWQIGVMFFELLTGELPFQGSTTHELYSRILESDPRPIHELRPDVPREIERVVERCLAKDPGKRYASGAELHRALSGTAPAAVISASGGRRRTALVAGGVAATILVIGGVVALQHGGGKEPVANPVTEEVSEARSITVDTADGAAHVYRDGKLLGDTPYVVTARPGETVSLVLKRQGYSDRPVQFDAGERKTYTFTLEQMEH